MPPTQESARSSLACRPLVQLGSPPILIAHQQEVLDQKIAAGTTSPGDYLALIRVARRQPGCRCRGGCSEG